MLEVIRKRRSVREYLPKEVEKEKLDEILKAAMFSPTAHNRRSWEFIVVKDKDAKEKLSQATPWSGFAKEAPVVLVLCSKEDSFWIENCGIAAANIYLETVNQGLGTCFVQIRDPKNPDGRQGAEEYVRKILNISKDIRILCLMPLGYPVESPEEHNDSEVDIKKIHYDKW
ncbi:MAG: nitroreductase family protein [bacterium]|nr:nitroreductase family protein [bacterium]